VENTRNLFKSSYVCLGAANGEKPAKTRIVFNVDSLATLCPLISLRHLSLRYSQTEILRDVSLDIAAGEHTALIGPNGSGKSSLLRILSGELWPARDGGTRAYSLDGVTPIESPLLLKPHIRRVAPEMQERFLRLSFPLSTYEFVASGLTDRDYVPGALNVEEDARVWEIMERLGLQSFAEREARRLSHGTLRRAFVARALVARPLILALDEVTDGLDNASHVSVLEQLDAAVHEGVTLICVGHRLDRLPGAVRQFFEIRDTSLFRLSAPRAELRFASTPVDISFQGSDPEAKSSALIRCEHVGLIIDEQPILHDILDEIFDGLDASTRALLERELLALAQRGTALVIIAHVAQDIPEYVDRRIVLERGRIIEG
jgi:ABC-type molybdenum transport system ATPase subunit/photorepair protein PhrA